MGCHQRRALAYLEHLYPAFQAKGLPEQLTYKTRQFLTAGLPSKKPDTPG